MEKPLVDWNGVDQLAGLASKSNDIGHFILNELRGKITKADPSSPDGMQEREMALAAAAGIVSGYRGENFTREVIADAVQVLAENKKYDYLAYAIYTYSGFREDFAIKAFAAAGKGDVAIAIEMAKNVEKEFELDPLTCFAAFGREDAFRIAADELRNQGKGHKLGEAARISNVERAKRIVDIAAGAKMWGALLNASNNDDKSVGRYAVELYRNNVTISDVDAAAVSGDWTCLSYMFEWCTSDARDRAFYQLVKGGRVYASQERGETKYLQAYFIRKNGIVKYVRGRLDGSLNSSALLDSYKASTGIK